MKRTTFFVLLIYILFISIISIYLVFRINHAEKEVKELVEQNEFKKELIHNYEIYYDISESLLKGSKDSTMYLKTKETIDSLYKSNL